MKTTFVTAIILLLTFFQAQAADLYRVSLDSPDDAMLLNDLKVEPVLRVGGNYIITAPSDQIDKLIQNGMQVELIATRVELDDLYLDRRMDDRNKQAYPVIFEYEGYRLFLVEDYQPPVDDVPDLMPLHNDFMEFKYKPDFQYDTGLKKQPLDLDSIAELVDQDTLTAYLYHLQSYFRRVAGTTEIYNTRDWIHDKFESFGYDSVYNDPFTAEIGGIDRPCYNVVAVKPGTTYPEIEIIVGAHYDGVPGSPAVDDNGSGTVGVLELARIFSGLETDVTFKFITFDAEEWGLHGSWDYADKAVANGDKILLMFNMDMIAHIQNTNRANLKHGDNTMFAQQWIALSQSISNITGYLAGGSSGSDHHPFDQNGYDVIFLQEYYFSYVYHSYNDSTTYINFDYLDRMVETSAAMLYQLGTSDDFDSDGIVNSVDNCLIVPNLGQVDTDADQVGDICDNCVDTPNQNQADSDHDGVGDACDGKVHFTFQEPPDALLGIYYEFQFEALGGTPPYTWTKIGGQIPYGITLEDNGLLAGTPTWSSNYQFTVQLSDASNPQLADTATYTIVVEEGMLCGDSNGDTTVDVSDAVYIINYAFAGGPAPDPYEQADANCDTLVDVSDAVYIINYAFSGGNDPCDIDGDTVPDC
jgi:hypothetical protein